MQRDVDFIVLDDQQGWSDEYELSADPIELDGFMIQDLLTYREGLFASMLSLFENQMSMRHEAIRSALASGDLDDLRHQAHELAGGAAYVGAACLARHARAIETLARRGALDAASPLVAALDEHSERTLAALRAILRESKGDSGT